MNRLFGLIDVLKGPRLFEIMWHLVTRVSLLTNEEIQAASLALGPDAIRYQAVRVAEGRLLRLVFRVNGNRAFTTFHTINHTKAPHHHSRPNVDIVVHGLVHVYQFEVVGSIYIWQALRAQRTNGYGYGGPDQLALDRSSGKHFHDFNREQQGKIAEDYYSDVSEPGLPITEPVRLAYEPFIEELRNGDL